MRTLIDLVDIVTSNIRRAVGMLMLFGLGAVLIITMGLSYAAPKAAESVVERAEVMSEKMIKEAREERRAALLAKDGWGYDAAAASADPAGDPPSAEDGWGS